MRKIPVLLIAVLCLGLTGCATIFHGSSQTISISSDPPDALAKVGGNTFKTPAQAILRRDADYVIVVERDGYELGQGILTHSVHWPTFLGNIIFGGLIGWAIDFSSGSAYKLEPENLTVPLKPKAMQSNPGGTQPKPGGTTQPQ
jgi:hypothetical protein